MPEWPHAGAIIAVDSRDLNNRLFAVQVVGSCCRADFLRLAGVDDDGTIEVYFRDLPWPMPAHSRVGPVDGDLVLLRSSAAAIHFAASLADMLLSCEGWATSPSADTNTSDVAWVLGPDGPLPLHVPVPRQHRVRHEIARGVDIPERALALSPAFGGIEDFANLGVLLRNVVVARACDSGPTRSQGLWPVCTLDLRPVMLQFDWIICPEGIFRPELAVA